MTSAVPVHELWEYLNRSSMMAAGDEADGGSSTAAAAAAKKKREEEEDDPNVPEFLKHRTALPRGTFDKDGW